MSDGALFRQDDDGTLVLEGNWLVSTVGEVDQSVRALDGEVRRVDLSGVEEIDTVGAYLAWSVAARHDASIEGADERATRLIEAVQSDEGEEIDVRAERAPVMQRVMGETGDKVINFGYGTRDMVGFFGAAISALGAVIRHPSRFRSKALVRQMELIGVSALGIVGLMSFLIGIVVAQQGAVQLRQFGAEIYTINLTGRLCLRELGVLMTAIMVAGRSGSAFAAQIGTMQLTEEVDAMRTIGIAPMEALVVPRILAIVFMMPLLGFYASVMAIIGGAFVSSLTLGIPFATFLSRVQEVVPTYDLWVGLIKAPLFGLIIALTGCYQGMQVKGDSEQVGLRTTTAVVQGIFAVIVLDAFFAVFFSEVGWA